jgi:S-phase kinase-associated protein 1
MIKVLSSDDIEFQVEDNVIMQSYLIKNMVNDLELNDQAIPLVSVQSSILKKILEYAEYHKDDPVPTEEDEKKVKTSEDISDWDREFMNMEQDLVFELVIAANYLEMRELLDLGVKTIANMIKGKDVEEIREIFGIENDFTEEEEAEIKKQNEWGGESDDEKDAKVNSESESSEDSEDSEEYESD